MAGHMVVYSHAHITVLLDSCMRVWFSQSSQLSKGASFWHREYAKVQASVLQNLRAHVSASSNKAAGTDAGASWDP